MVEVQIVRRTTELAAPSVSFEHLIPKRLVLSQRELQPRHFLMKFIHDLPWAADELFRHGTLTRGCMVTRADRKAFGSMSNGGRFASNGKT
jgi:hypothetical protein